jgi:hypothetical protein
MGQPRAKFRTSDVLMPTLDVLELHFAGVSPG